MHSQSRRDKHTLTCSLTWIVDESWLPALTVTVRALDFRGSNLHSSRSNSSANSPGPLSLCAFHLCSHSLCLLWPHTHTNTHPLSTQTNMTHTHTQVERTVSTWLSCCARHTLCRTSIGHRQVLNYVRRSTPTNDTAALQTTLWNCWPDSCSICRLTDETGTQSYIKPQSGSKCHTV